MVTEPAAPDAARTLAGRAAELDQLVAAFDEAAAGRGGVALLAGEPGIGKTRLADELAASARARGARVVWGRCPEGEGAPPFWPWVQVLRGLLRDGFPDAVRGALGRGAAAVAELVPEVRDLVPDVAALPPLDPAQARFRLFDGIAGFLQAVARGGALVLIVDDLHWTDASSLALLRFVAAAAGDAPLLVLGTYRGDEIDAGHPLARVVADVARLPRGLHLTLRGLDAAAVGQVVAAVSVTRPSPALVTALAQDTHGNPLFVLETVRLLQAEGRLGATRGDELWRGGIPLVVREVIARRLARLSPACQGVLTVAAVLGREFDTAALAAVEPATRAGLFEALGEAETARVIEAAPAADDRYRFTHSLLRETLYEDIPRAARARLHLRAGEALAARADGAAEAPPAELARHFFHAAALGGAARAVAYARQATDRALEQLAYEEAARLCELALRALALAPVADPALACELLLVLGDARTRAGDIEGGREAFWRAAEHARRVARREDAGRFLARAALGIGGFVLSLHPPLERLAALLEEALATLGGDDDPLRAQVLGRLAMEFHADEDDARRDALSREAVACARRSGDARALAIALLVRHNAMRGPDARALLPIAAEAVAAAEATGDAALLAWAYRLRAIDLTELGEVAAFDRDRRAYAALAERLREPYHRWQHALWAAMRAALGGRFGDAEALAGRALDLGRRGPVEVAELYYALQVALLRLEAGRAEEALALFGDMPRRFPALDGLPAVLAVLQLAADDAAGARLTYERLVQGGAHAAGAPEAFAGLRRGGMWLMTVALLARAAVALGDTPRMAALYALLLPHGELTVMAGAGAACLGAVSHHLGLLAVGLATAGHPLPLPPAEKGSGASAAGGTGAEATPAPSDPWVAAERHFRAALARHERTGAPGLLAHTRYELARLLGWARARGATSQAAPPWAGAEPVARALLGEALATAQELGMARLAGLAAAALETPRPEAAVAGPGGLTARELEVLCLLGRGAANKAIAAALVLSVRTVERHIMNLYPKIGAHNRAEATAYAIHHHLV